MHRLPIPCIRTGIVIAALVLAMPGITTTSRAAVTREEVERAIRDGIRFLKGEQKADGSWEDFNPQAKTGTTSLVTLALLTAGERADSPTIRKALEHLRHFGPDQLRSTYAIALQTMVFAAAEPERDQLRIVANVTWLESAQIKPGERGPPGCWTYTEVAQGGRQLEHPVRPPRPERRRRGRRAGQAARSGPSPRNYWEKAQTPRRRLGLPRQRPDRRPRSMTCAGISSLIITGTKRFQGQEYLQGTAIHNCGQGGFNPNLQRGHRLAGQQLRRRPELPHGPAMEALLPLRPGAGRPARRHPLLRPARLVPPRRRGAGPRPRTGSAGSGAGSPRTRSSRRASRSCSWPRAARRCSSTSSATARAATGTTTPTTSATSSPSSRATGRACSPGRSSTPPPPRSPTCSRRPILFFNGHQAPEFDDAVAQQNLRDYVEQGGFLFADACCGSREFDDGFKRLMKQIFPEDGVQAPAPAPRSTRSGGPSTCSPPRSTRSGASSTAAARSSSTRPRTSPATGTRPNARPPTRRSSWPPRSARTSSTTPPAASCPPTS